MPGFVEELVDESLGASSKRWAIIVLALGVGALGAWWVTAGDRPGAPPEPLPPEPDDDGPTLVGTAATQVASAWRRVSTPPAVMRKALGARTSVSGR